MMRSLRKGLAVAAIVAVFLGPAGYAAADPGRAVDCQALKVAIDKEMTLMVKKSLIEKAMAACPGDIDIVYQHGYTLERLRKYKDALQSYKKAIALDPNYSKAYFSMGDVQMVLKSYREAAEAYIVGLRLDPADARAKASLADARARYHDLTGKTLPAAPVPTQVATASTASEQHTVKTEVAVHKPVDAGQARLIAPILRLQVPFDNQSAELTQEAKDVLAVVVGEAMQSKEMAHSRLEIGGYTDNFGDPAKDLEISKARAEAVKKYLTENFAIDSGRLKIASYGQSHPLAPNTSAANRELNRRVEFRLIK